MIQTTENTINFKAAFEAMPGIAALIKAEEPLYVVLAVTEGYMMASGLPVTALVGQPFFDTLSNYRGAPDQELSTDLRLSFEHVIAHNEAHQTGVQRFDVVDKNGQFAERYWKSLNKPVTDDTGKVMYVLHSAEEITQEVLSVRKDSKLKLFEQAHHLFMQAPVAIHIFRGEDLIIALANEPTLQLWGKNFDVTGLPAREVLPEISGQGYIDLLQQVRTTGKTYSTYESPVTLVRNGREERLYLNFVLQAYYEDDSSKPAGVMVFCNNVTDRVNIKKELVERNQSLALAIEIGELGLFTVDLQTYIATFSSPIGKWFGLNESEMALYDIFSKMYPADHHFVKDTIENSIKGESNGRHDLIYRVVHPANGSLIYLRSIGQVKYEDGIPVSLSGIIQEVTDQVLATKKIEESEERFRTMAESTEVMIAVADKTSNFNYFNQAWTDLTGKPMEDLINFGWADLVHPDDRTSFLDLYLGAFEDRLPFSGEFRILNKAGEYRWLLAKVPVRLTPDGEFAGYISSCIDITDRKNAEQKLQQNDTRLRELIAAAPVAIALFIGRNLTVEMANQAFFNVIGKEKEIVGKHLAEVMPELEGQSFLEILDNVYTSGIGYRVTSAPVNIVRKGELQPGFYDFSYTPLLDAEGKVYAILDITVDVTAQVLAKKELEDSEQNLRNTILQAPVAMCILKGINFVVDIANERMLELWGKSADAIINKSIFEGLPEVRGQGFEKILHDVYTTGETYSAYEVPVDLPRSGQIKTVYVNFVYEAFRAANGDIYGIMAVAVDVTEQVLGRKTIEASEQRVRSLVESAPFPIGVYIGREMRIALVNQSIIDTWGKGTDLVGKLYADVLPELDNQDIYRQLDQVYTTGISFHAKNQLVELIVDGRLKPFYFNYSFTPLFDSAGQVYGIMNTAADVTDLNISKQKVEESERNFRNLVMQAPVGICIVGGEPMMVEMVNDSFLEITGKKREHFNSAEHWEDVPDIASFYEPALNEVFKTGDPYRRREQEIILVRGGVPETVYINFVYEPVKEADGRVKKVMILVFEVTQQVLARQKIEEVVQQRTRELAEANKALQQNNEELGQFAYIASHDLQEPLRKVSTFTDMLKRSLGPVDEKGEKYFERILASTKRMSQLIQDVLNFSQLSKNRDAYELVDLNEVIQNIVTDFELLIEQKKAVIQYKELPSLEAVPLQMQQLFGNLISNALKFSRPDLAPVINITARRLKEQEKAAHIGLLPKVNYYSIDVADNGIGFSQEYAERIFNIFQRLHTKSDYAGTGIGLALCKKITQNHQGEISALSGVNTGSVFNIILPEQQAGKH